MVRCSGDEVGIVIAENPERKLRPKLLLVRDDQGHPYPQPRIVDLSHFTAGGDLDIADILPPGEYDFDVADFVEDLSWVKPPAAAAPAGAQ